MNLDNRTVQTDRFDLDADQLFALQLGKQPIQNPGFCRAIRASAEIAGIDYAQAVQLSLEYAPEPPFECGRPERARPEIVAAIRCRLAAHGAERVAAVNRAARLLHRGS